MAVSVGLGFRRDLADVLIASEPGLPHFVEFAPENWMGIGGRWGKKVSQVVERYPVLLHGLSLSLGSPEPLDWELLKNIKAFIEWTGAEIYSEHLSFSKCGNAHLYDLLPLPFTEEAVKHVSLRIREAQDFLGRRIAIENVTYYTTLESEMDEATFISSVLEEADCDLLLDINNVYINAHNHSYDPKAFLNKLPMERLVYIHIAGHKNEEGYKRDTHAHPICNEVYDLLAWLKPKVPILLERDDNCSDFEELKKEMERVAAVCS